jgi:CRISPR/Cas system CMR-associated protein Cmr5 small subunit
MKIKQCLISFPVSVIGLICLLVGIVCYNNYINNYKYQLALRKLIVSAAMLQHVETEPANGVNKIVVNKLNQLKQFEKETDKLNSYSQIASVFILIGSLLLGVVFFYNLNAISAKLNKLSAEIKNINKIGLEASKLNFSFDNAAGNEIDCLATTIEEALIDFKRDTSKTNFMLRLFKEANKQLKQQLAQQSDTLFH